MRFKNSFYRNLTMTLRRRLIHSVTVGFIVAGLFIAGCSDMSEAPSPKTSLLGTSAPEAHSFVQNAHLPSDAYDRCTVSEDTVASWFGGEITANGWVNPADSTAPDFGKEDRRCNFYIWGAQMFLWLTSETGAEDKHVMSQSPVFYDISISEASIGQRSFVADNGTMILEAGAKTDTIEFGEASDSDVLITQDGSVVYFALHANDVFALYTTAINENLFGDISSLPNGTYPNAFPATSEELDNLNDVLSDSLYANYLPIPQPEALAMELKTAWVDASGWSAEKLSQYVYTEAKVPLFDSSKPNGPWPITGTAEKPLALVGMHVVGTVDGHPEMIWATFEHVNNSPANAYTYNTNNDPTPGTNVQPYDSSTNDWALLPRGHALPTSINANSQVVPCVVGEEPTPAQVEQYAADPFFLTIVQCDDNASGEKGDITNQIARKASVTTPIEPTDVARIEAWGGGTVANNTNLISLNKSVLTWMKPGDHRGNYIQTGSIWTSDGSIPTGGSKTDNPELVGSLKLANTTMETYDQIVPAGGYDPINCFGCHGAPADKPASSISHIFDSMESLIPRVIVETK